MGLIRRAVGLGAMAYAANTFVRRYAAQHPERVLGWIDRAESLARKRVSEVARVEKVADAARTFVKAESDAAPARKRERRATSGAGKRSAATAS